MVGLPGAADGFTFSAQYCKVTFTYARVFLGLASWAKILTVPSSHWVQRDGRNQSFLNALRAMGGGRVIIFPILQPRYLHHRHLKGSTYLSEQASMVISLSIRDHSCSSLATKLAYLHIGHAPLNPLIAVVIQRTVWVPQALARVIFASVWHPLPRPGNALHYVKSSSWGYPRSSSSSAQDWGTKSSSLLAQLYSLEGQRACLVLQSRHSLQCWTFLKGDLPLWVRQG